MRSVMALCTRRRVLLSWVFGLVFVLFSTPSASVSSKTAVLFLIIGIEIAFMGEALRIWASGYLFKDECLSVSGPFSYTRNPLYLGSFLIGFGFCLASAQMLLLAAFLLFFTFVFAGTIVNEERILAQNFGAEFVHYKEKVPVFIPSLVRYDSKILCKFNWRQVIHNREYLAFIGVAIIALYLMVRFYIRYNTAFFSQLFVG